MRELSRRLFGFGISSASKCVLSYELSVPYRTLHDRKQGSQRFFLIPVRCASAARIQPEETSSVRNLPRARRSLNEPTRDWKAARTLPSWSVVCTEDVPRVSPEFGRFPGQADSQDCEKCACCHTPQGAQCAVAACTNEMKLNHSDSAVPACTCLSMHAF